MLGAMLRPPAPARAAGARQQRPGEVAQAVVGLMPALVALGNRDLAAYHGVEHKAIGAYEAGSDDPATATKEHDRCGSNLVAPMVLISAVGQLLVDRLLERPARSARGGRRRQHLAGRRDVRLERSQPRVAAAAPSTALATRSSA